MLEVSRTDRKRKESSVIRDRLEQINYRCGTRYTAVATHLNATAYGVAQNRERFFLIAFRDGQEFCVPSPTCGENKTDLLPLPTAWDAIGNLTIRQTEAAELVPSGKWASLLPSIPEGENYLHHTTRGTGMPLFGWRTRYWSFLLKLAKHQPAWTLQADPGPATGPFHWDNRLLSIAEIETTPIYPRRLRGERRLPVRAPTDRKRGFTCDGRGGRSARACDPS